VTFGKKEFRIYSAVSFSLGRNLFPFFFSAPFFFASSFADRTPGNYPLERKTSGNLSCTSWRPFLLFFLFDSAVVTRFGLKKGKLEYFSFIPKPVPSLELPL